MTVCPRCNGNGSVPYPIDYEQGLFDETNCHLCGGSGEVITEQEYIQTCNTEQLAEWINNIVDDGIIKAWMIKNNCCGDYLESVKWWLKQPHSNS